jgi:NADPH:quinone reductase-like Zn-dependent oxidoreductase
MKAARALQFGPPNVIMTSDLPRPEPGAGQLLVCVKAAGVGNWDALLRGGETEGTIEKTQRSVGLVQRRRRNQRVDVCVRSVWSRN